MRFQKLALYSNMTDLRIQIPKNKDKDKDKDKNFII